MDIRVAIFEDNKLVRDALETVLNGTSGFCCCGAFADGNRWETDIRRTQPDVVLMDIGMPGINGIELTKKISDQYPHIKVLIQTVFNESEKIFSALCAGACGYILKNDPPHKYIDAINDVHDGGAPFSAAVAKQMLTFFSNQNIILVAPGNEDFHLSEREKEILKLMEMSMGYKAISEKLFISYKTVRTHVRNIYKKLHVTSRNEAVMKARQQGLA